MADLFLMVGLPGAGKTTYAQKLAKETGAVRFTPDEWHIFLFGDDFHQVDQEVHDSRHNRVEDLMWKVGQDLLQKGRKRDSGFRLLGGGTAVALREKRETFANKLRKRKGV